MKTIERATAKKDRSWWHNALLKLSWWHVVLVIIINDVMLIAVGSMVGSAFYSIEPIKDGSFRADRIEVEGLAIDPENGAVLVSLESEDKGAELSLRSFAGEASMMTLSDLTAPIDEIFTLQSKQEDEGKERTLKIKQGDVSRFTITESVNGNGTDVWLDPSEFGQVVVKGGMAFDYNTIQSAPNSSLELLPSLDQDIILQPTGSGQVGKYMRQYPPQLIFHGDL